MSPPKLKSGLLAHRSDGRDAVIGIDCKLIDMELEGGCLLPARTQGNAGRCVDVATSGPRGINRIAPIGFEPPCAGEGRADVVQGGLATLGARSVEGVGVRLLPIRTRRMFPRTVMEPALLAWVRTSAATERKGPVRPSRIENSIG